MSRSVKVPLWLCQPDLSDGWPSWNLHLVTWVTNNT